MDEWWDRDLFAIFCYNNMLDGDNSVTANGALRLNSSHAGRQVRVLRLGLFGLKKGDTVQLHLEQAMVLT